MPKAALRTGSKPPRAGIIAPSQPGVPVTLSERQDHSRLSTRENEKGSTGGILGRGRRLGDTPEARQALPHPPGHRWPSSVPKGGFQNPNLREKETELCFPFRLEVESPSVGRRGTEAPLGAWLHLTIGQMLLREGSSRPIFISNCTEARGRGQLGAPCRGHAAVPRRLTAPRLLCLHSGRRAAPAPPKSSLKEAGAVPVGVSALLNLPRWPHSPAEHEM